MAAKGFVTVATGDEKYFIAAKNLLDSYLIFHKKGSLYHIEGSERLPFAIIADRHNRYTELFDDVIILENASRSYFDKLSVLRYIPYDETVFVESDCIAYSDLNEYFEIFRDADEFAAIGRAVPRDSQIGWFRLSEAGKYRDRIEFIPRFHSAVLFMRKGKENKCAQMYDICLDVSEHYDDYMIGGSRDAIDDKLIALSSAAVGCPPVTLKMYYYTNYPGFLVNGWRPRPRMHRQMNSFNKNRGEEIVDRAIICHWGNYLTTKYLYKREIHSTDAVLHGKSPSPYVALTSPLYLIYKLWERDHFIVKPKVIGALSKSRLLKRLWHRFKKR